MAGGAELREFFCEDAVGPSGDDVAESGEVALLEAGDEAMGEIRVAVIEKQNLIGNLHCFRQALE